MQLRIEALDQSAAEEIASWHYEGEYTFYDFASDQEDLEELLNPELRGDSMYTARNPDDELVGFYSFNQIAGALDIGVGLRPDLTGQGLGRSFVDAGLTFAKVTYSPEVIQLRVAAFNKRAIKVYKLVGFAEVEHFRQRTNGGEYDFIRMERLTGSTP